MNAKEAYRVLGLRPQHSEEVAKKHYKRLLRSTHPDLGGSTESFLRVQEAWAFLNRLPQPFGHSSELYLCHLSLFDYGLAPVPIT